METKFSPSINILYGENAQGKTNLLEAIYLIATGRSFRTPHLHELIREGESFFFLEAILLKEGFEHAVQIAFDGKNKKLTLDGNIYSTFQHLLGLLPSVLHTPWDGELVDGSPNVRRKFCNLHLAQKDPIYIHHLTRYWRAMRQRNALLKINDARGIECWELEMAESANYLWAMRKEFLEALKTPLQTNGSFLSSGKEMHTIKFLPGANPEHYLTQLAKNRSREKLFGNTLLGPHRDDFSLWINERAARIFASEGQKKTAVFGLRLAEWELFTQVTGNTPLLGIDDLGLHLDPTRETLFRNTIHRLGQTFITTPHLFDLPDARRFRISNGQIH
jgi:DNA replication and repair protein RecF